MKNFIFITVFVAVLTVETVCAEDSKQTEKAVETISFEEFQTQHEEIMSMISVGVSDAKGAMKILEKDLELHKEANKLQNARIEKMLRGTKEGREEYNKAVEKYFSSDWPSFQFVIYFLTTERRYVMGFGDWKRIGYKFMTEKD